MTEIKQTELNIVRRVKVYILHYIYLPYTYTICNIEGSTPIYRLNDRQSATCRSLAESAACLYQMTTNHNNNNKMMKKQKKKNKKEHPFY